MSSTRPSARGLCARVDEEGHLPHPGDRPGGHLLALDRDARGLAQVALRDRGDARRHRGREERRLPLRGRRVEERLDVLGEAHVQHLVRLVEDEDAHLVELQRAPLEVVERPAGRRHHDVGPALERADLLVHRRAAVEGHDAQAEPPRVLVDRLGHLHRQLARGDEDEGVRAAPGHALFRDPLQHRQRERRGLAGARRGLPEHVLPAEQDRNGLALDGRRLLVAEGGRGGHERVGQPEGGEIGGVGLGACLRHAAWYRAPGPRGLRSLHFPGGSATLPVH